ncbi:GAF domain-containing protein [Algibacillus agarilyticus]|uniref:GAF domain-containing protein n=1 Tax=Algibacillus agarilyticus TaxID=2234133 RepID=UPI00130075FF|nr:GAF domain-containing protein [Algibacillus agarilyticus]
MDNQQIQKLYAEVELLKKDNRRLNIANQLTHEFVGEAKSVKQLIAHVFDRVLETLDAEAGSLWLVDPKQAQNICHLAEGPAKKGVLGLRLPSGKGVVGAVIQSKQPEVILDCSKDARFSKEVDARTGFVTRSMICVPLVIDDKAYGAIQIVNKKHGVDGQFDEEDQALVIQLAIGASLSVKNARLLEMESRVKEMNVLMEISKEVVATLDVDQVLALIVNKTNELVDITGGAVALLNEKSQSLQLMVLSEQRKIDPNDDMQNALIGLMEQVKKSNRVCYVPDVKKYKLSLKGANNVWVDYLEKNNLNSIWAMPLEDEEGLLGVVIFESQHSGFALGSKADMLHILCSQATVALRNASLFKSIPFSAALSSVAKKNQALTAGGWRKYAIFSLVLFCLITALHYLPYFRWVSGPAIVEARLGQGVFLPIAGRLAAINVLEGQLVQKDQTIGALASSDLKLQLIEANAQLAIIERQLIEARAKSDTVMLNQAAIERETLRAKVIQAETSLNQVSIKATINGIVLTPRPNELVGRVFNKGDEIIRLADPEHLLVIVHIPEIDLMDVQVGQTVKGVLRAQPGDYFMGKVKHVGRQYDIPNTVLESDSEMEDETIQTGFIAEIEITDSPFQIKPGMTGHVIIHAEQSSLITKIWRRVSNFFAFHIGF